MSIDPSYIPYLNTNPSTGDVNSLVIRDAGPNSILYANAEQEVKSLKLGLGEIIVGTEDAPAVGTLSGTPNQIIFNEFKLSLPQDIAPESSPTFNTVNGRDISADGTLLDTIAAHYVTQDTNQRIDAWKQFNVEILTSDIVPRTHGLFNIGNDDDKYKDLHLSGDIITEGLVNTRDIAADGTLLDTIASNYVTLDTEQTITSSKTFTSHTNIDATLYVSGTVNGRYIGIDGNTLDHIAGDYVTRTTAQTNITGAKTFDGATTFNGLVNGRNLIADGMVLDVISSNYVTRDSAQTIAANKIFTGLVNGRNLTADGALLTAINTNYVTTNTLQHISGAKTFIAPVTTNSTVNGRNMVADGIVLDNLVEAKGNYVTLDSEQKITGRKTFESQYLIHEHLYPHMEIRSTLTDNAATFTLKGNGNGYIVTNGGLGTDFYSNDKFWFRSSSGDILNIMSDRKSIHPGAASITSLGTTALPFKNLYLGEGTGIARLGHSIRADESGRAELHLHSNGDQPSDIHFGVGAREDVNVNWNFSSRESVGGKSDFKIHLGPRNTSGGFIDFLVFKGAGTAIHPRASNVLDLGEEKKRFKNTYSDIILANSSGPLTTYYSEELKLTLTGGFTGSNPTTANAVKVGTMITITFPYTIHSSTSAAPLTINGIPERYWPNINTAFPITEKAYVINNNTVIDGTRRIHKGSIVLNTAISGNFGGGFVVGYASFSVTYVGV